MRREGPPLAELLRHLRDAPPPFARPPRPPGKDAPGVDTYALVCDVLSGPELAPLDYRDAARRLQQQWGKGGANALALVQAVVWVLAHPSLAPADADAREARGKLLLDGLTEQAAVLQAAEVYRDDERGEELVRVVLAALGLRPAGERPEAAADRLGAIDSVERARVLIDARRARERKVLEEMKRREAEEAAAKTSRE